MSDCIYVCIQSNIIYIESIFRLNHWKNAYLINVWSAPLHIQRYGVAFPSNIHGSFAWSTEQKKKQHNKDEKPNVAEKVAVSIEKRINEKTPPHWHVHKHVCAHATILLHMWSVRRRSDFIYIKYKFVVHFACKVN